MVANLLVDPTFNGCPIYQDLSGGRVTYGPGAVHQRLTGSLFLTGEGIGAQPVVSSLTTLEKEGTIHRTVFTIAGLVLTSTYSASNGSQCAQQLYTFPRGLINIFGATSNLTILADGVGIVNTAAVVAALGTVSAPAAPTLTSTAANIAPSFAATLTAGAGVAKVKSTAGLLTDNTTTTNATQEPCYLNFAVPVVGTTAQGTLTVNGTIEILWVNLGDS